MSRTAPPLWLVTFLYYMAWIGTVQLAAHERPFAGLTLHLAFGVGLIMSREPQLRSLLWRRATLGSLIGYGFDSALITTGVISFPAHSALFGPTPLWMTALWFSFCVLLNGELRWLLVRSRVAVLLGLIGGPLSYLGGAQSGAMLTHGPSWRVALIIGAGWASLMGLAAWLWAPQAERATTPDVDEEEATPNWGEPR